jgi:hypothetical protein
MKTPEPDVIGGSNAVQVTRQPFSAATEEFPCLTGCFVQFQDPEAISATTGNPDPSREFLANRRKTIGFRTDRF